MPVDLRQRIFGWHNNEFVHIAVKNTEMKEHITKEHITKYILENGKMANLYRVCYSKNVASEFFYDFIQKPELFYLSWDEELTTKHHISICKQNTYFVETYNKVLLIHCGHDYKEQLVLDISHDNIIQKLEESLERYAEAKIKTKETNVWNEHLLNYDFIFE